MESVSGLLDSIERNAAIVSEIVRGGELREPEPE
jgi:hypothetical protein